ncbi:dihydroorotate dehydrogenase [Diplodia corticola]|uniref:Dihydroorotate dehydrogenase n=1 Tax=Diplodia corticola TaxID=236234 RepID=A0A1J9SGE9_9PEZI|nr:dihydroorotate dehydrogenase [Diplodia corticola]OJD38661.1 dihydroorotate dehydrogenase [Diplodia corticola]
MAPPRAPPPPPPLTINPPLLNSANPWATTLSHLLTLYASPYTGAVTTRTSLLDGYPHDDAINQYTFFSPTTQTPSTSTTDPSATSASASASLNTLGYSPLPLRTYLSFITTISAAATASAPAENENGLGGSGGLRRDKPIIVSVTGSPADVARCYDLIRRCAATVCMPLAMEVNLSCPNIDGGKPVPAAYDRAAVVAYLVALRGAVAEGVDADGDAGDGESVEGDGEKKKAVVVPIGLKTPPFTHAGMFADFVAALTDVLPTPISFVTAVNTLAPSLVLVPSNPNPNPDAPDANTTTTPSSSLLRPALGSATGLGTGGMAGAPLHPLALGNVLGLTRALGAAEALRGRVMVVGVGGVEDAEGWRRMRGVGAGAVGVGTALGRLGVGVFERIWRGVEGRATAGARL